MKIKIAVILAAVILLSGITASAKTDPVRIALIDSGIKIDSSLPDAGNITAGKNYIFEKAGTDDLIGHGTVIAGIILRTAPENVSLTPLVCFSKYPSGVSASGGVEGLSEPFMTLLMCMTAKSLI